MLFDKILCWDDGTGPRGGLKIRWAEMPLGVRIPLPVQKKNINGALVQFG